MTPTQPTPYLPIGSLEEIQQHYLNIIRPLLSTDEYTTAKHETQIFFAQYAPQLQQALHSHADQHNAQGSSWLIEDWLNAYLSIRTPLPLTSNVGFRIQTQEHPIANWISAVAAVYADYHHNRIDTPISPQGAPVSMTQWQILNGAARIPQQTHDKYRIADNSRHIGIWHKGCYHRIAALNEQYEAYSPDIFHQAFTTILTSTDTPPYSDALPCYLGSDESALCLHNLCANPNNAALLNDIETDLFHVCLNSTQVDADTDLAHATFLPDCDMWCYKPITFRYNTTTDRLFLHCEHTWEDGGMLKALITHATAKLTNLPQNNAHNPNMPQARSWHLDQTQQQQWTSQQKEYAKRADTMRVKSTVIPFNGIAVPKGISHDALMQFILQFAQLSVYGKVHNTYEAVDVSHFQAGRTECVRPVSEASLQFIQSLRSEKPDREVFHTALAEHKSRIKTAKIGTGANRQLLGLQLTAQRDHLPDGGFFQSHHYRLFNTDFLSTSTIGDDAITINFAFAPTTTGGLGINYTLTTQGWLFTISHHTDQQKDVAQFIDALHQGGNALLNFISS